MKKESIFTKEGFFGCDVFSLWFWKLRRSTLLRKVFSAVVEIRRRFPEEVWSSSGRKKQVDRCSSTFKKEVEDFSQRLGKTGLSGKEKHSLWVFFSQMRRRLKLFTVVSDQAFSILPMIFSVVLLEDVIVEDWGGFQKSSPSLGRTRGLLLWPNFNHGSRENAGTEVTFFFFRLGCCSGAFYILGSAGFLIRMVSNK